ncbi:hypothetical protein ES703_33379 [subsurface metagenome]
MKVLFEKVTFIDSKNSGLFLKSVVSSSFSFTEKKMNNIAMINTIKNKIAPAII